MTSGAGSGPPALDWLRALREPQLTLDWDLAKWQHAVRLSRRLRLLGRLAEGIDSAGLLASMPEPASRRLTAELRFSRWRINALNWVLERLVAVLCDAPYPLVLLKGAAYIGQDLQIAAGRLPSDADILVPREHVCDAQGRLIRAGWSEIDLDEHDRRYYHEWSHEVPPMRHPLHTLELDLHHNILPPVAHTNVDADLMLARLRPSKWPRWQVLHPLDQVLHTASHLFHDSDARDRLRDLVDLDGLLRHFGDEPSFWAELPGRAEELGLTEPLALACHFSARWLQTPMPQEALDRIESLGPTRWHRAWLQPLLASVLTPTDPDRAPGIGQNVAAQLLLARYHFRRMPLRMLVGHLWHKAAKSRALTAETDANGDR